MLVNGVKIMNPNRTKWAVPMLILLMAVSLMFVTFYSFSLFLPNQDSTMSVMQGPPAKSKKGPPTSDSSKENTPKPPQEKPKPKHLSEHIVEYHISVALNAEEKSLDGIQSLTWKNPGALPVEELYFHLYPNAFQSKETTFLKESGGKLRQDEMKENSFGFIRVSEIKTANGNDLTTSMRMIQPDDGNESDQTLMKIKLPEPVNPGEETTIKMKFKVQLPYAFARMGYVDNFVMAGQWFPKIALYEKKGMRGRTEEGWNLHQYHGNSEFYADFGIYTVRIEVPQDYTVAATGFPTKKPLIKDTVKVYQFYADDVHDFAWAASPDFVYKEEPFSTENVPGVKIKLYLDPAHEPLQERYFTAAKKALGRFSEWYGPYPYSTLSIVVPPKNGNGAGGMEYPTLITGWSADDENPSQELERVIVHEIGHQFFYGMVASNEFEEAWLDEGFTSYAEDKLMELEYGMLSNRPVEASYITSPAPLKQFAWHYKNHQEYAENVYTRAKLVLMSIEKEIGEKLMQRVLKTYFSRYRFKHPTTEDFQKVLEEVSKKQWDGYFDQFVYNGQMIDYSVEGIKTTPIQQDGKDQVENIILIQKHGAVQGQVPILIYFRDGTTAIKQWDGSDSKLQLKVIHAAPVEWVAIDPEYEMILENKHINNFLKTEVDEVAKVRWNIGTAKIIEAIIDMVAW
jgi:hypothetical protein